MQAEMTQINVRIDSALKERGDDALLRAGYSPSQAIRKLWSFAARNVHDPRAIRSLLDGKDEPVDSEAEKERARRREAFLKSANIVSDAYERLGIKPSKFTTEASYDELREFALLERLRERGLDA